MTCWAISSLNRFLPSIQPRYITVWYCLLMTNQSQTFEKKKILRFYLIAWTSTAWKSKSTAWNKSFTYSRNNEGPKIWCSNFMIKNHDRVMYTSWDMECDRQNFLPFWAIFCPFTPLTTHKIKILQRWKTTPADTIILHMCTKNQNYMMYDSWDMEGDRQNFLSFWAIFCPFTPLITQKIKILKKWKNHLEMSTFYIYVSKTMIVWCMLPEIWSATDRTFCHFGPFIALLPF